MRGTVIIDNKVYYNDFMPRFRNESANWIASGSINDRRNSSSPEYIAIGLGSGTGDRNSLERECLRLPIMGKFIEPVSARSTIISVISANDVSSIAWKEIGLYDSSDTSLVLNRCDVLGKWQTDSKFKLYSSGLGSVQDSASLFCEFNTSVSCDLFRTVDLTDGKNSSVSGAISEKLYPKYSSYVEYQGGANYAIYPSSIVKIGDESSANIYPARTALTFDFSALPSDASITKVKLGFKVLYVKGKPLINISPFAGDTTHATDPQSAATLADHYNNSIHATKYITENNSVEKVETYEIDLGTTAASHAQTSWSSGGKKFCIGISESGDTAGERIEFSEITLNLEYSRTTALGVNARQFGRDSDYLQFYLFLSDPSLFSQNQLVVELSSSETANTHEWEWTLQTTSLVSGWNFMQLSIGEATKTGTPDPFHIKRFRIGCNGITSAGIIGLDNIRLFRQKGNLLNRLVLSDSFVKNPGTSVTIQWIIDPDIGVNV